MAGDVRIAWMDTRHNPLWNTYYRSSTNGVPLSPETQLELRSWLSLHRTHRFQVSFGDYFEMDIDNHGDTQAVWGEG
jgi:hypothetical protein